ncbi:cytochrome P450 [Lentinus tigrinus ALCF2SS1-7]|uniref:Cytochrome P450 n=1 Tax=Lentinus tigrinus ALCF2SS1-6 TaxID=1328759 RepID=A0A5C2SLN9_9APHY|nr:cytochrome P450 [Lentinus tigrinus ALCF2SS1-6]RPD82917.1 cytochrome P450 [Lentinus tigrinus ALCF2SS1-7]
MSSYRDGYVVVLLVLGIVVVTVVRRYRAGRHIRKLRGPPCPSSLFGHLEEWGHQSSVGDLEEKWWQEYGTIWKLKGCLNEDFLMVADPKALQHILHKSGYHFVKGALVTQLTREINGESSLVAASGSDHARMRKIMNPAFTSGQLRSFLPLFRRSAQKLARMWTEAIQNDPKSSQRMNVLNWISRCTLDIIGEVAFDVDCGALDDSLNPIMQAYRNMFAESLPYPARTTMLFRSVWPYLPDRLLRLVKYLPTKDHIHFRRTLDKVEDYSWTLVQEKTKAILEDSEKAPNERDIMSIIVRANASEDPKHCLSRNEMISQMATLLLGGHETTSNTVSWLLYELARHPEHQAVLREEIRAMRARISERGDSDFSMSDFDSMHFVVAAIKEILRLHPIVYMTVRVPTRDEVLPLAYPVTNVVGETVNEVPIPKGTNLYLSIWTYNRLPQIWGPDAHEFNPNRFLKQEKMGETYVGVTSNLMSFGAGLQACLGWRFALIEIQAILVELIERFAFTIPEDSPEIVRLPAGLTTPIVKGEEAVGAQMPLHVTPI